jgi:hypothetical protein
MLPKKVEFLAKAKICVQHKFKHQYEELLAKHNDVFSKYNQDSGKANDFKHNILFKNNEPRYQKQQCKISDLRKLNAANN